jgi:hypothetical protein
MGGRRGRGLATGALRIGQRDGRWCSGIIGEVVVKRKRELG